MVRLARIAARAAAGKNGIRPFTNLFSAMQERLQKIIARAGIASRRKAEELIEQGLVTVNGQTVVELGSKADPDRDHIKVRGKLLAPRGESIYLVLNKPKECVSTTADPQGRRTVLDFAGRFRSKVYPVGRLDYHSEGLLLLTNDGEFANHVLSAKNGIPKTYHVKINGNPVERDLERFRGGVRLDGRLTAPAKIRRLKPGDNPWFEVTIIEGRQNQIRRMFKALGFLVEKLKRVRIGPLTLGALPLGRVRELTPVEVARLAKPVDRLIRDPISRRASRAGRQSPAALARLKRKRTTAQPINRSADQ
jgi:23S rRNA pseudouridine2605 synthase